MVDPTTVLEEREYEPSKRRKHLPLEAVVGLGIIGVIVVAALLAPLIAPYPADTSNLIVALQGPSAHHWFGTDELGRDVLSRIIWGARTDVGVTVGSLGIAFLLALPLGLISGYRGGTLDHLISGFSDTLLTFPSVVLAIILVSVVGGSLLALFVALVTTQLPVFVRFLRSYTIQEREQEYVIAAIASGASDLYILTRVLLPNIWARAVVVIGLAASEIVLMIAALGYLGLGIQPPSPEWGSMLSQAQSYFTQDPYLMIFPGIAIMLFVLAANLLSQGAQRFQGRS